MSKTERRYFFFNTNSSQTIRTNNIQIILITKIRKDKQSKAEIGKENEKELTIVETQVTKKHARTRAHAQIHTHTHNQTN